jgi:hypothetical protein
MASKEPQYEDEEYEDEDYNAHLSNSEETFFETPVPGQVQQLKPDRIDPHRTVRIKEGTPEKNAKIPPAAPIKSVEISTEGLRSSRLIRANLFQAGNNTAARNTYTTGW